ncbi:hypothetical protein CY35_03G063300 [Sphagnum magellanicum]|nr:hypothetical protein CY35_03G063300 [Sphagnum magellanicum]
MARPVGHFQCWKYICWGHFPHNCQEELGITLPSEAFELLFVYLQQCVINDGKFINNEYNDVYLLTLLEPIPLDAFFLCRFLSLDYHFTADTSDSCQRATPRKE